MAAVSVTDDAKRSQRQTGVPSRTGDALTAILCTGNSSENKLTEALALQRYFEGSEPFLRRMTIHVGDEPLSRAMPPGGAVVRSIEHAHYETAVVSAGEGWTMLLLEAGTMAGEGVRIAHGFVTCKTREGAAAIADALKSRYPQPEPKPDRSRFSFWTKADEQYSVRQKDLACPPWATIAENYPNAVRAALGEVMAMRQPPPVGRLILLHGAPGTGKTTAIRALCREWAPWCDTEVVVDAESLFGDVRYLTNVLLGGSGDRSTRRWRVVVVEDADELVRASNQAKGTGVGRLLNSTDGLIGMGSQLLVLLTTNEPLSDLHPALIRPGRCLASIEFSPFSRREAQLWLGDRGRAPQGDVTLADLYCLAGEIAQTVHRPAPRRPGAYL